MIPPSPGQENRLERSSARAIRVVIGALLLFLTIIPVYRLLDREETGLAGRATVGLADIFFDVAWTGFFLMVPVAILGALFLSPETLHSASSLVRRAVMSPPLHVWLGAWAAVGAILTAAFSLLVLEGKPNLADAFVQLLHARYWAEGFLAGPNDGLGAFWAVQNSLFTEAGWVSQYPPGHIALLALFLWLGTPWLLGPILVLTTVLGAGALAHRLYPEDPIVARIGAALVALSPFIVFLSGAYMNHATSAACVMLGAYAIVRGWQESPAWMLLAGAVLALSLATRPLSTLAMSLTIVLLTPLLWRRPVGHLLRSVGWGALGAAPILGAWFAYNQYFFGSPFRLGYSVAHGEGMSLGFHRDPWGNVYGLKEAVGYTSSDLVALGTHLFESPLSAIFVIGAFLILARSLRRGTWLLLGIAVAPVLSNMLYWHHGIFMGPRMLHEAAPAWVLLFTVAAIGLVRRIPETQAVAGRYHTRPAVATVLVVSVIAGILIMAPARGMSYGGRWMAIARMPLPDVREPAVVFVHDAWSSRITTTLTASGMRLDAVETLMRQNPTCDVHSYASAVSESDSARARAILATLDTLPRAEAALPYDNGIRIRDRGAVLTPDCEREVSSDSRGVADITPLLWQADLHGDSSAKGILIVRDLGPERNAAMLEAQSYRMPFVYLIGEDIADVRVMSYGDGMELLWNTPRTAAGTVD